MVKEILVNGYRRVRNICWMLVVKKSEEKKFHNIYEKKLKPYSKEKYYVISCENMPQQGLFGYVGLMLAMMRYAYEHNMIPIIDMKNYPNTYLEDYEVGKINAWELFFQQVCNNTIEDVYKDCTYVMGNHMDIDWYNMPNIGGYHRKSSYFLWSNLYDRFVKLSDQAQMYCDEEFQELLEGKEKETLGLLIRGTDIKTCKGHALQPSIQQVISKVEKVLKKHKTYKYIYLATEEYANEKILRDYFPDMIIVNKRTYYDNINYEQGLSNVKMDKKKSIRGMEYLSSVNLLSKCDSLLAGQCGGSFAAYYMNGGKYRYCYFWELGIVE